MGTTGSVYRRWNYGISGACLLHFKLTVRLLLPHSYSRTASWGAGMSPNFCMFCAPVLWWAENYSFRSDIKSEADWGQDKYTCGCWSVSVGISGKDGWWNGSQTVRQKSKSERQGELGRELRWESFVMHVFSVLAFIHIFVEAKLEISNPGLVYFFKLQKKPWEIFWAFISVVKTISKFNPKFTKTLCPKEKDKLWQLYFCKFVVKAWGSELHYSLNIQKEKLLFSYFCLPSHSGLEFLQMSETQIKFSCISRGFEPISHKRVH